MVASAKKTASRFIFISFYCPESTPWVLCLMPATEGAWGLDVSLAAYRLAAAVHLRATARRGRAADLIEERNRTTGPSARHLHARRSCGCRNRGLGQLIAHQPLLLSHPIGSRRLASR